jgi:hypothetical protein
MIGTLDIEIRQRKKPNNCFNLTPPSLNLTTMEEMTDEQ